MCSLCSFLALRDKSCPLETFPQLERNSLRFRFPNNLVRDYVENAFAAKGRKYRKAFVESFLGKPATDLNRPKADVFLSENELLIAASCNDLQYVIEWKDVQNVQMFRCSDALLRYADH